MSPSTPRFAPARVERESRVGGGFVLRSPTPLRDVPRCVGDMLVRWAREAPSRVFLAERRATGEWRAVTYAGALAAVRLLADDLLDRGLGPTRPCSGTAERSTIDEGKPAPGAFEHTVKNLRELSPTAYFNVPRGFDMLVGRLEEDPSSPRRSSATSMSSSTPLRPSRSRRGSASRPSARRCAAAR